MGVFPLAGQGFVYVVKVERFYRIGRTSKLHQRLSSIELGVPFPIVLVYSWETEWSGKLEAYLHRKYEAVRMHGEWFALGDEHIIEIGKLDLASLSLDILDITYQTNFKNRMAADQHPLAQWRNYYGVKQSVLAEACQTPQATICSIERGHRTPRVRTAIRLMEYTGLPIEAFIRPARYLKEYPNFLNKSYG